MNDTQWPRYEVFKQDTSKKRHEAIGSVHAPDSELALLNARNVFGRRPNAVSMWVVPETAVFTMTAEELEDNPDWYSEAISDAPVQTFHIFNKQSQRRAMAAVTHVGTIGAQTAVQALHEAVRSGNFADGVVYLWWVVPETAVTRSSDDDVASMFAPAKDKTYRQQSHYGFVGPSKRRKHKRDGVVGGG